MTNVGKNKDLGRTLEDIEELPEKTRKYFCEMVDECFLENQDDPELKEGFDFLDSYATSQGITVYNLILQLYELDELNIRVSAWKKEKGYK